MLVVATDGLLKGSNVGMLHASALLCTMLSDRLNRLLECTGFTDQKQSNATTHKAQVVLVMVQAVLCC
jgi:hypothetical protein